MWSALTVFVDKELHVEKGAFAGVKALEKVLPAALILDGNSSELAKEVAGVAGLAGAQRQRRTSTPCSSGQSRCGCASEASTPRAAPGSEKKKKKKRKIKLAAVLEVAPSHVRAAGKGIANHLEADNGSVRRRIGPRVARDELAAGAAMCGFREEQRRSEQDDDKV